MKKRDTVKEQYCGLKVYTVLYLVLQKIAQDESKINWTLIKCKYCRLQMQIQQWLVLSAFESFASKVLLTLGGEQDMAILRQNLVVELQAKPNKVQLCRGTLTSPQMLNHFFNLPFLSGLEFVQKDKRCQSLGLEINLQTVFENTWPSLSLNLQQLCVRITLGDGNRNHSLYNDQVKDISAQRRNGGEESI